MYITSNRPDQNRRRISISDIRTLWLSSLGSALEFYDFIIFVFFAAVIGKLLFSSDLPDLLRQLQTYSIFAVGYLARPLGGIVMAHFGDLYGPAFSLTSIKVPSYTPLPYRKTPLS